MNVSLPNSTFQLQFEVLLTTPRAGVAISDINTVNCSDDANTGLFDDLVEIAVNNDDMVGGGDVGLSLIGNVGELIFRRWIVDELGCVRFRCRRTQVGILTSVIVFTEQNENATQLFVDDSTGSDVQTFTIDLKGLSNYFLSLSTKSDVGDYDYGDGSGSTGYDLINIDDISFFPVGHQQCLSGMTHEPIDTNTKHCDFEDQAMCAYGLSMNCYSSNDLLDSSSSFNNPSRIDPYAWHSIFNTDRVGFVANASGGVAGERAQLQTSIGDYMANNYRCLTFSYAIESNPTSLLSPKMTLEFFGLTEQMALANFTDTNGRWLTKSINISHLRSNRPYWSFSFFAQSGGSNSYVAIDDIILTESSCDTQLPFDCLFEIGDSCGWLKPGWTYDSNQHGLFTWRSSVVDNVPDDQSQLISPFIETINNQRFCIALNFSIESYLLPTKPSLSVYLVHKMNNGSELTQQIAQLSLVNRNNNDENGNFIEKFQVTTHFGKGAVKLIFNLPSSDVGFVMTSIHNVNIFQVVSPGDCSSV